MRELERSLDVPEHRHLAQGVRLLRARARALQRWCAGVLNAYESDRQRWGSGSESIDEQRNGARRRQLRTHVRTARKVEQTLRELTRRSRILLHVPPTVGALRPTPLWLARGEYRQAYDVLRELASHGVCGAIDIRVGIELVHREADAVEAELRVRWANRHLVSLEKCLRHSSSVEPRLEQGGQHWRRQLAGRRAYQRESIDRSQTVGETIP